MGAGGGAASLWAVAAAVAAAGAVYHGLRAWGGGLGPWGGTSLSRLARRRTGSLDCLRGPGAAPGSASGQAAAGAGAAGQGGGLSARARAAAGWVWPRLPGALRASLRRDWDLVGGGRAGDPRDVLARGLGAAALALAAAVAALGAARLTGSAIIRWMAWPSVLILPPAGLLYPLLRLRRDATCRRAQVLSALPEALDLLAICTAAGLNLPQALGVAAQHAGGGLGRELGRLESELLAGRRLSEALGALASRLDLWPVSLLAGALMQAEALGTPLAEVMRAQTAAARTWRRQAVEARIGTLPTRLTLVSIFLLMPAVFVVAVLPNVLAFVGGRW
ncbi:MAG: type II secretion system F family protein [Acetobacteraceae bacterium]|nr:type II secretion system F family protein [Acetobacteraceae bacterium]